MCTCFQTLKRLHCKEVEKLMFVNALSDLNKKSTSNTNGRYLVSFKYE